MAPIIWAFGGVLTAYMLRRQNKVRPSDVLATPAIPPQAGRITPARTAIHGELMAKCVDPQKLHRAAMLFGHEGLPHHAQALLHKATMVHNMLHGAQSLVERCNAGDQHAMALVKGIGEQARLGNKRAQMSAYLINEYVKSHPHSTAA